jgi:hypothetical protein
LRGAGVASGISSTTVTLPAGNYSRLSMLAAGSYGSQLNQTFVVTYTDGTSTTFTQSLSDWGAPQSFTGESVAVTMAYRVTPTGATQNGPWYLYGYAFTLNPLKTVKSLTLPANHNVTVMALDLTPPPVSVSLASKANVYALDNTGVAVGNGGLDTFDYAYSEVLLGNSVSWSGLTFSLGNAGVASALSNTTLSLPAGAYSSISLLATGVNGSQLSQAFVVTYTDGTSTTFTQSLSDWGGPQNYTGESQAVSMAYRIRPSGATQNGPWYLYGYTFALNAAKTVKSIALPANRDVVVMAIELTP